MVLFSKRKVRRAFSRQGVSHRGDAIRAQLSIHGKFQVRVERTFYVKGRSSRGILTVVKKTSRRAEPFAHPSLGVIDEKIGASYESQFSNISSITCLPKCRIKYGDDE